MGRFTLIEDTPSVSSPPSVGKRYTLIEDGPPEVPTGLDGDVPGPKVARTQPRTGDALKPLFGGHNPIAETYDTFVAPLLDVHSNRSAGDRIADTINFAASVPFRAVHAPTLGDAAAAVGFPGLRESEDRFVENNPGLVRALGAAGELAAGATGSMGQGFRSPTMPAPAPRVAREAAQVADDATRMRTMTHDMRDLQIEPFGPVVAGAGRADNSAGAITQSLADKPFVGTPIQRGARNFLDESGAALDRIRTGYGESQTMQGGGANVRSALTDVKEARNIDVRTLGDAELQTLAKSPPRLSSYGDVQSAKYELAERQLPSEKARGQPVAAGEERMMGGLPETVSVLREIKRRYGLTINKSEAARATKTQKGAAGDALISLDNAPDFANPQWTASANVNKALDTIAGTNGRQQWRTGLEGMREIRSMIRRTLAAKPDSEVNALARSDLKRLYSAVSRDMDGMLTRLEQQAGEAGNAEAATRYRGAREAYKDADAFTARYADRLESVRNLFQIQSDEGVAGSIRQAMQDGTKGNLAKLVTLRSLVPREAMDEFAASLLVDLGRPTGRAGSAAQESGLSLSRWASQWNSLSPRARQVVFGHRPEHLRSLDQLARVANASKDFEALANNSRTGVSNAVWATIGAGGAGLAAMSPEALAGLISTAMLSRAGAHYLSSPLYVRWLTRARMAETGAPINIMGLFDELRQIVARDGRLPSHEQAALLLAINQAMGQDGGK